MLLTYIKIVKLYSSILKINLKSQQKKLAEYAFISDYP